MVGSVGGAQLEMGGEECYRGMDRQRWWGVWEGHSWKWEGKSARGMDSLTETVGSVGGAQLEMGGKEC